MDLSIASILALDGLTNGAIYALLALATVLVFAVTRVIFIPQGEFVAFGALTLALLQPGKVPGTVWFLLVLAGCGGAGRRGGRLRGTASGARRIATQLLRTLAYPVAVVAADHLGRAQGPAAAGAGGADAGAGHALRAADLPPGLRSRWPTPACWCC